MLTYPSSGGIAATNGGEIDVQKKKGTLFICLIASHSTPSTGMFR